jgi:methylmalonyl-CoA/ethylmalonyl-CoA epimerase
MLPLTIVNWSKMSIKESLKDYIIGLQHIGHIVEDMDDAIDGFVRLYGIDTSDVRRVPEEASDDVPTLFAFLRIAETEFELIQPVSESSRHELLSVPSGSGGINHVAWRVSDVDACIQILGDKGIRPGHVTPDGVVSFANKKLVYLNAEDCGGLLVELIEIAD